MSPSWSLKEKFRHAKLFQKIKGRKTKHIKCMFVYISDVYYILLPSIYSLNVPPILVTVEENTNKCYCPRYLYKITMLSNFAINIKRWYKHQTRETGKDEKRNWWNVSSATHPSMELLRNFNLILFQRIKVKTIRISYTHLSY